MSNAVDEKEVIAFWHCDICGKQFEHDVDSTVFSIEGHPELICEECYCRGIIWSVKEAWKEEVLRKGDDC